MTVGVIVSTYRWPEALDRCLASLATQSRLPDQVIVADDGSGPDTEAVIERWRSRLRVPVIHCWQPDQGFRLARIRNLALVHATADYLLFIDGDQVLHRHFVRDHLRAAKPGVVVRGSRAFLSARRTAQLFADGRLPRWWQSGVSKHAAALRLPWLAWLLLDWRPRTIEGHNLACWREEALAVNGFEERFVGWGGEDADFVTRLLHRGSAKRRLRFAGIVYHLDHPLAPRTDGNDSLVADTIRAGRIEALDGVKSHQDFRP